VAVRGNNRERIFRVPDDRDTLLAGFGRTAERYGWTCHAYCLMGNHIHFMLQIVEATLAAGMQQFLSSYAKRFNRRYGRSGHLFGTRYYSLPVETESHLLELCRYVVLNPVRAGACLSPADWPWSSYRPMVGLAPAPRFLTVDWLLEQFGRDREDARRNYARFVAHGL
jgi:REP element-mobilizing transposase RayT